jgi:hypothetical protein
MYKHTQSYLIGSCARTEIRLDPVLFTFIHISNNPLPPSCLNFSTDEPRPMT